MEYATVPTDVSTELLSTSYVARELNYSEGNIRRLADIGVLKCERSSNGQRLFRRSEIEKLRASRPAAESR